MLRIVILGLLLSFVTCFTHVLGQGGKESYRQAYDQLVRMLDGKDSLSFKKAVFITENAYLDNTLSYDKFNAQINTFSAVCRQIGDQGKFTDVKNNLPYNWSIYKFITDTLPFRLNGDTLYKMPYRYDTLDPTGEKDITNTFVLKLISTGTGNCRSLPYLYKILADELKAEAGFALAPYHLYIKHYDAPNRYNERRVYNVELTNGSFPRDGWIVASSYITWTAIKKGMFGVRLDDKKTIALCLGDLAVSYERKFGTDDFLIKLYHTALKYHPVNAQNRLRLAETYRKKGNISLADSICKALVFDGYREMPDQMYNMWLSEIRRDKDALHSDTSRTYEAPKDIFGNPMPTLSKGKFKEDADLTDSTRVGSVVVDCETGKVIRYLKEKRVYDVSRFLSVDPLAPSYPYYTPYQFAGNTPITAIDIDGLEPDKELNKNETSAKGDDKKPKSIIENIATPCTSCAGVKNPQPIDPLTGKPPAQIPLPDLKPQPQPVDKLQPSQDVVDMIIHLEGGFNAKAYSPGDGTQTIGYGHVLKNAEEIQKYGVGSGAILTQPQAEEFLKQDLATAALIVKNNVKVPLLQHQFDAMVSFAYNAGTSGFKRSDALKAVNAGNFTGVEGALNTVVWAGGQKSEGLVKRRAVEAKLFNQGVYTKKGAY